MTKDIFQTLNSFFVQTVTRTGQRQGRYYGSATITFLVGCLHSVNWSMPLILSAQKTCWVKAALEGCTKDAFQTLWK